MKYCRFVNNNAPAFGLIESVAGRDMITRTFRTAPGALPDEDVTTDRINQVPFDDAKLLAPTSPSKIVCVGRNYFEHAKEFDNSVPTEVLIFLKPPSSVIAHGEQIKRPNISQRVDHEAELAVVIGQRCRHLRDDEDVKPYIHGYTCLNDVTARDLQKKDGQWTRGKGFDTFCPVGPLVTDEVDPWAGVSVECRVNNEVRQNSNTSELVFKLDVVIRYIAQVMTLLPGDIIATGTPAGVSPLNAGDIVDVICGGIGTLRNPVVDE